SSTASTSGRTATPEPVMRQVLTASRARSLGGSTWSVAFTGWSSPGMPRGGAVRMMPFDRQGGRSRRLGNPLVSNGLCRLLSAVDRKARAGTGNRIRRASGRAQGCSLGIGLARRADNLTPRSSTIGLDLFGGAQPEQAAPEGSAGGDQGDDAPDDLCPRSGQGGAEAVTAAA